MNLFSWLLVGHLLGDFLFQNRWMAENKSTHWLPLFVHSLVYTTIVSSAAIFAGSLSIPGIFLIFLTHLILDRRSFVRFWARRVTGTEEINWLLIMADQSWHILVLAAATKL